MKTIIAAAIAAALTGCTLNVDSSTASGASRAPGESPRVERKAGKPVRIMQTIEIPMDFRAAR